jgi:hypothetical protein
MKSLPEYNVTTESRTNDAHCAFPFRVLYIILLRTLAMSKRKSAGETLSTKQLNLYRKSYKGGGQKDLHFEIFKDVRHWTDDSTRIFYPGCHRHVTASLVFPTVLFVDCDTKVGELYSDTAVSDFVAAEKVYEEEASYEFYCLDVNRPLPTKIGKDFDLLISLSAGIIVEACTKYVRQGGFLLVNDSHGDASMTFVGDKWELLAYYDNEKEHFTSDSLHRCFQVKVPRSDQTEPMAKDQAKESAEIGSRSKRSFKLLFESMFYLFKKKE